MFILAGTIHDPCHTRGRKLVWVSRFSSRNGKESILPPGRITQVSLLRQQRILASGLGRCLSLSLSLQSLPVFFILAHDPSAWGEEPRIS